MYTLKRLIQRSVGLRDSLNYILRESPATCIFFSIIHEIQLCDVLRTYAGLSSKYCCIFPIGALVSQVL